MRVLPFLLFFCLSSFAQKLDLKINGELYPADYQKTIKILGKERTLNIEINTEGKYEYLLENHQTAWTTLEGKGMFSYNDLPGGLYWLKIKQNQKLICQIKLDVAMPFFRTWYFLASIYFFGAMILGMIIYFFLLYKFRQQAKLQKVRNNIAADLHDDVGATLTSIGFFGELIRQKIVNKAEPADILALLSKVIDSSKESVETMRGVVWTINPNNDFSLDFFEKLKYYAQEMLGTKSIELVFDSKEATNKVLSLEQQRNLFLFFKEVINNIMKHSEAQHVQVCIKSVNQRLHFEIKDDGRGFDTDQQNLGHGLKNLRKRIESINGSLIIKSQIGNGTKILVDIP